MDKIARIKNEVKLREWSEMIQACNRAERAVKPFVIGRKNWLFSDTDKGADSSALCYALIESAKQNRLDVYGYLLLLLTELPKLGAEPPAENTKNLLPWAKLPDYCYIK